MNMLITVRSREWVDTEESDTTLTVPCEYRSEGSEHIITYREEADGQTGGAAVSTTLRVTPDTRAVTRKGETRSDMLVKPQTHSSCLYTTPYGQIPMKVYTHRLSVSLFGQYGGQIAVRYTLALAGAGSTEHELHITLSPQPRE